MFTGIITHLAQLREKRGAQLMFTADRALVTRLFDGASVSVNGVCLTVTNVSAPDTFTLTIMPETGRKTMLGDVKKDDIVNLELPTTAQTLLSGHMVQGHVDGTGMIQAIQKDGNSYLFTIAIPKTLRKYIVDKGAISVNGISLTVIKARDNAFTVGIIPYTWTHTMLHTAQKGDRVNVEVDVIAKYVEKLLKKEALA